MDSEIQQLIPGADALDPEAGEILRLQREIETEGDLAIDKMRFVIEASVQQGAMLIEKQAEFGDAYAVWFEECIQPHGLDQRTAETRIKRAKEFRKDPASITANPNRLKQALLGEGLIPAPEGRPKVEGVPLAFTFMYRKTMPIAQMHADLLRVLVEKSEQLAQDREQAIARLRVVDGEDEAVA